MSLEDRSCLSQFHWEKYFQVLEATLPFPIINRCRNRVAHCLRARCERKLLVCLYVQSTKQRYQIAVTYWLNIKSNEIWSIAVYEAGGDRRRSMKVISDSTRNLHNARELSRHYKDDISCITVRDVYPPPTTMALFPHSHVLTSPPFFYLPPPCKQFLDIAYAILCSFYACFQWILEAVSQG